MSRTQIIFVQTFSPAFEEGDFARMYNALNGDAAFCFKMVADNKLFGHFGRNGAVCQQYFVAVKVYKRRIGHKAGLSDEFFYHQQGHDGLQVAFASGRYSFVIQQRKGQAACGLQALDQREAGQGKSVQVFFLAYTSDGFVQAHGPKQFFRSSLLNPFGAVGKQRGFWSYFIFRNLVESFFYGLNGDVRVSHSPTLSG